MTSLESESSLLAQVEKVVPLKNSFTEPLQRAIKENAGNIKWGEAIQDLGKFESQYLLGSILEASVIAGTWTGIQIDTPSYLLDEEKQLLESRMASNNDQIPGVRAYVTPLGYTEGIQRLVKDGLAVLVTATSDGEELWHLMPTLKGAQILQKQLRGFKEGNSLPVITRQKNGSDVEIDAIISQGITEYKYERNSASLLAEAENIVLEGILTTEDTLELAELAKIANLLTPRKKDDQHAQDVAKATALSIAHGMFRDGNGDYYSDAFYEELLKQLKGSGETARKYVNLKEVFQSFSTLMEDFIVAEKKLTELKSKKPFFKIFSQIFGRNLTELQNRFALLRFKMDNYNRAFQIISEDENGTALGSYIDKIKEIKADFLDAQDLINDINTEYADNFSEDEDR